MQKIALLVLLVILGTACEKPNLPRKSPADKVDDWLKTACAIEYKDLPELHHTYLSVYSTIYHRTEKRQYNLSVTISLRNTSASETLVLHAIDYYNGEREKIRSYLKDAVCLGPMITREILINAPDIEGGVGGNFIFEWHLDGKSSMPVFEAVMISTSGQQGLSFVTTGVQLD